MKIIPSHINLGSVTILNENASAAVFTDGMTPKYKILSNYDHLVAPGSGDESKPYRTEDLSLILKDVLAAIKQYSWEVKALAKHLYTGDKKQDVFNTWHWSVNNIEYKLEPEGLEILRSPSRSYREKLSGIDCDCFTILTGSILKEMGYRPSFVVIAQNNTVNYTHIYTVLDSYLNGLGIVEGGLICDPVMYNKFNRHPNNITKSLIMKVQTLDGIEPDENKNICGLSGLSPDVVTLSLQAKQTELINSIKKGTGSTSSNWRELRKIRSVIIMNGMPQRDVVLRLMPYIYDVDKNGNYIYTDRAKAIEVLKSIKLNGLGFDLNPFNNTAGGAKWSENEANNYYSKAPGKVDSIRYIINRILTTDPEKVQSKNKNDFAGLLRETNAKKIAIEIYWTRLQGAANKLNIGNTISGYLAGNNGKYKVFLYDKLNPNNVINLGLTPVKKTVQEQLSRTLNDASVQALLNQYASHYSSRAYIDTKSKPDSFFLTIFPADVLQKLIDNGYWLTMFRPLLGSPECKLSFVNLYDFDDVALNSKIQRILTITKTPSTQRTITEDEARSLVLQYADKDSEGNATLGYAGGYDKPVLTSFPEEVLQQLINNGYWFALSVSLNREGGFTVADNRAYGKIYYELILDLEDWANKADNHRHNWTTENFIEKFEDLLIDVFNPAMILIRAGILWAYSWNFKNMARMMYIGYMTDEELNAKGYMPMKAKAQEQKNIREAQWEKAGGDLASLRRAIKDGTKKKPFFGNIKDGIHGLGSPGVAEGGTAAGTVSFSTIMSIITSVIGALGSFKNLIKKEDSEDPDDKTDTLPDEAIYNEEPSWQQLGFSSEKEYNDYMKSGGGGNDPTVGDFSTGTIETWHDLFNYFKAAAAISLIGAIHPALFIPVQIGICIAFVFSLRKSYVKFINNY